MNKYIRNSGLIHLVLVLFISTGSFHIACSLGYCFCLGSTECFSMAEGKNHHPQGMHHAMHNKQDSQSHHSAGHEDMPEGCTSGCCDTLDEVYIKKDVAQEGKFFNDIDKGVVVLILSFITNSTYDQVANKTTYLLKHPPSRNVSIIVFVQSFLN